MADFSELLNTSVDSAERPKPLPTGTFTSVIKSFEFGKANNENQTPYCRFMVLPVQPKDDVDMDALSAVKKWSEKPVRHELWITEDSMWRFRKFLEDCGLNTTGRSFNELVPETTGAQIDITISHTLAKDGQTVYANISDTAPTA